MTTTSPIQARPPGGRPAAASPPPSDAGADLMLRVQRDEPGAFGELVREYGPLLSARFFRIFRNRQDAEDLTQEVFLRLYRCRKRYRPTARFSTWLYHVTQNVARNMMRNRRRRIFLKFGLDGAQDSIVDDAQNGRSTPTRCLEQRETGQIVRGAVSALRGKQRRALEMLQFQNRSYHEIATTLGLTSKATKSLLYRARLQVRQLLEQTPLALE